MRALRYWVVFLWACALYNALVSGQMLLAGEAMLGDQAGASVAAFYLTLCGILLGVFAGVTALLALDPARYWPLGWFAAVGRTAAGATILAFWRAGVLPDRVVPYGTIDVVTGIAFVFFCLHMLKRRPVAEVPTEPAAAA